MDKRILEVAARLAAVREALGARQTRGWWSASRWPAPARIGAAAGGSHEAGPHARGLGPAASRPDRPRVQRRRCRRKDPDGR
ncbi:hypothetical protein [Microvirga sp. VF16]|uniref:hypothetical protein n=1 Tax=Microvirga sp. VF16 TaxID=2807101 RepID=UPI00193C9FC2|nr:hypothetical protein [Microvirga sp. VF16]QRM36030.1 hypothetical protein JO965_47590 [Microvirga sp. VF16]